MDPSGLLIDEDEQREEHAVVVLRQHSERFERVR